MSALEQTTARVLGPNYITGLTFALDSAVVETHKLLGLHESFRALENQFLSQSGLSQRPKSGIKLTNDSFRSESSLGLRPDQQWCI